MLKPMIRRLIDPRRDAWTWVEDIEFQAVFDYFDQDGFDWSNHGDMQEVMNWLYHWMYVPQEDLAEVYANMIRLHYGWPTYKRFLDRKKIMPAPPSLQ